MSRPNLTDRSRRKSLLTIEVILAWADDLHARTGRWPRYSDGAVEGVLGQTWAAVDQALRHGNRGLPGGSTLAILLLARRRRPHWHRPAKLSLPMILRWVDAHRARTGDWPNAKLATPVPGAPLGTTWAAIELALHRGKRGLPGGSSIARLLERERMVRNRMGVPDLSESEVLAWVDEHRARTGRWPKYKDGAIGSASGETWTAVDTALLRGKRGLPGGDSLAKLLARHRGVRNRSQLPHLQIGRIREWAAAHFGRTGRWPSTKSGPVVESPGETWGGIHQALAAGQRGLPGGSALAQAIGRSEDR